ncbi:uncharacterized protein PFL1_05883 [Pseudozyma flocculosa PF-1]|uniref:Mediator of RNA polymerase II transcription subunit 21 n=2 Tax=Pseudozyma flocculosa TaxID=84751 RepID=A0A5C3F1W8_9BASI|nr:uncharacterized protein PFL1_05883 [Pseudozyma flocculosa PF-1]EPQ26561.1 hypothetical protein PFL1_05883 [Pseudozyma flocculosa PF-1]SPO38448.1 uncharacterized protein PSFLO_03926 [Pseudozyma flocculosa]
MDLVTQLDNDIDLLLKIMSSSIAYVSRKAKHQQLPDSLVPLTITGRTEAVEPHEMSESIDELVADLVLKAKEIQEIILHLPDDKLGEDETLQRDLAQLESEMRVANQDYRQALKEAETLRDQVKTLTRQLCDGQAELRAWLVKDD